VRPAPHRLRSACAAQTPRALQDLQALLRLPSVADQAPFVTATAIAVADLCTRDGAEVLRLDRGGGFPAILARWRGRGPRTLLLYNHYDVQPADPEGWASPPFAPTLRGGRLFARGAADNKGDLLCRLAALRAWTAFGGPPCDVLLLVDGEEESGSPSLRGHLADPAAAAWLAAAEAVIWEFGGREPDGRPDLYLGVKGLCELVLRTTGAAALLHAAMGAIAPSPAWRLVWALGALKGPDGRVLVPGFHDAIRPPTAVERAAAARLPLDEADLRARWGVPALLREGGADPRDALLFAPTWTVTELRAGAGAPAVLPREAVARLDIRLVPEQDPARVAALVEAHLAASGFADVAVDYLGGEPAHRTAPDHPFVAAVAAAARQAYGAEPVVHPTSAGSGPMALVAGPRRLPVVSAGCGYWGAQAHGLDENIRVADFEAAALHMALLLQRFAEG
jgi:acetylornithine deacetylase/succinyl-diaminopimelate desuccinylase-like protein